MVTPRVAFDWARDGDQLLQSSGGRVIYLPDDRAPVAGQRLRLPALAARSVGSPGMDRTPSTGASWPSAWSPICAARRTAHDGRFRRRRRRVRDPDQDQLSRAGGVRVPAQRAGRDRTAHAQPPGRVRARRSTRTAPSGCISRPKPRAWRSATATPVWPIPPRWTYRSSAAGQGLRRAAAPTDRP